MKLVKNRWSVSLLVVVVVLINMPKQVSSEPSDRNSTLMRCYCSMYGYADKFHEYFTGNLNATLTSLRQQLTTSGYATARTLFNGAPVWGRAWCRRYVSVPDCLDCFDYAVNQLKGCGITNSACVTYSDCEVRYETSNFFTEAVRYGRGVSICNKTISPQKMFQRAGKKLLSDLQIIAPRTRNFYAASTRKIAFGNATVYASAECTLNISQSVCLQCLKLITRHLYSCFPGISGRAIEEECFARYDTTPFFGQSQTTNLTSFLWDDSSIKRRRVGVVVGGLSFLVLVLAFLVWRARFKRAAKGQQVSVEGTGNYSYAHLQLATNNFSEENIIGKGGFGEVFKAILYDMKVVAVKKLKVGYAGAKVGFKNEILLISNIRHRNLLGLLGWCYDGSNLLLVLEYMSNGSLDRFLWGEKRGALNWKRRYDIILGIARGLAHLHKELHVKILHRDIKSSNILLDDNFQPKIADFGLAIFQPEDKSHVTTKFAGTLGYTSPEYVLYGHLSDKVDTFSFGVVILEIVSGRKCTYRNFDGTSEDCLLEHAWKLYETKNHMKLVDETMDVNQYKVEHVMNIIEISLLCTQSPVSKRPTMSEVVLMLTNEPSSEKKQLTRPNFIDHNWRIQETAS